MVKEEPGQDVKRRRLFSTSAAEASSQVSLPAAVNEEDQFGNDTYRYYSIHGMYPSFVSGPSESCLHIYIGHL